MKFYLTKAAQRAAETGQPPTKAAKAPKVVAEKAPKPEKAPRAAKVARAPKTPKADSASLAPIVTPAAVSGSETTAPWFQATPPSATKSTLSPVAAAPDASVASAATAVLESPADLALDVPMTPGHARKSSKPIQGAPAQNGRKGVIAIGGQPRVDLLPLEVRAERKAGQTVRRAWLGVAAVIVLVGIAGGAATVYAQGATSALSSAQSQTLNLSQQAGKYSKVQTVQSQVDLMNAAREVGGSTDIDWPQYLGKVALTVPTGATLSGVTVDSASPILAYAQAQSPLEGQRVATLTLTATSSTLPSVPSWLDNLTSLPGYVDATAGTVALQGGIYTSTVTLHINQKAYSNAFKKGK